MIKYITNIFNVIFKTLNTIIKFLLSSDIIGRVIGLSILGAFIVMGVAFAAVVVRQADLLNNELNSIAELTSYAFDQELKQVNILITDIEHDRPVNLDYFIGATEEAILYVLIVDSNGKILDLSPNMMQLRDRKMRIPKIKNKYILHIVRNPIDLNDMDNIPEAVIKTSNDKYIYLGFRDTFLTTFSRRNDTLYGEAGLLWDESILLTNKTIFTSMFTMDKHTLRNFKSIKDRSTELFWGYRLYATNNDKIVLFKTVKADLPIDISIIGIIFVSSYIMWFLFLALILGVVLYIYLTAMANLKKHGLFDSKDTIKKEVPKKE